MTEAEEFPPVTAEEAAAYGVPNGEAFESSPQTMHDVFRVLEDYGDLTREQIAEKTGWSVSVVGERLSLLVALEIVYRRPCVPNPRQTVYVFDPPEDGLPSDETGGGPIRADGGRVRAELPAALLPSECPQCEADGAKQTKVKGRYVCGECGASHDGGDDA